jgi:hypothetical protein
MPTVHRVMRSAEGQKDVTGPNQENCHGGLVQPLAGPLLVCWWRPLWTACAQPPSAQTGSPLNEQEISIASKA